MVLEFGSSGTRGYGIEVGDYIEYVPGERGSGDDCCDAHGGSEFCGNEFGDHAACANTTSRGRHFR